ncbi:hypothetical protein P43SY_001104 [Pythium insidiosum]|uniref:Purple acid phosphatase n=1 Tax=Pythium insidiosum TaxID=114742 RepID=A0AAD5LQP2_PYTIN|nr:hypothetical protein P43SY_001104 [Pythium insidiosum]
MAVTTVFVLSLLAIASTVRKASPTPVHVFSRLQLEPRVPPPPLPERLFIVSDDSQCHFDADSKECVPVTACSFQFRFGDLKLSQSCRVRRLNEAPRPVSSDGTASRSSALLPQHVHLAYAGRATGTAMTVSWSTFQRLARPELRIGSHISSLSPAVNVSYVVDAYDVDASYSLFSYHATVEGLSPDTAYIFQVGSEGHVGPSSSFGAFRTARLPSALTINESVAMTKRDRPKPTSLLLLGDLGVDGPVNRAAIEYLEAQVNASSIDFVLHLGDLAGANRGSSGGAQSSFLSLLRHLSFTYEQTINRWMLSLEPMQLLVPYMIVPGDRDAACEELQCLFRESKRRHLNGFRAFNSRFRMPSIESNGARNMWYSFDQGDVHFIVLNSESKSESNRDDSEGQTSNGTLAFEHQLVWLREDLRKAYAHRRDVPWIVVAMHRPIYSVLHVDVSTLDLTGDALRLQRAFEDLFIEYHVDVVISAHGDAYERSYPVSAGHTIVGRVEEFGTVYVDPSAPVYVVTGSLDGLRRRALSFRPEFTVAWNAKFDDQHHAVTHLQADRSTLWLQTVAIGTNAGHVLDELAIVKSGAAA